MPKVAIIYLVWNNEPRKYLERALSGVAAQTFPKANLELLIIYNSHKPEEASQIDFIKEEVQKMSASLPHTTILEQKKNLGFSGGNNLGMRWAVEYGFDYTFLHNADGYLDGQAIEKLAAAMESDKKIGEAQSLVMLHPETELINSAGNAWHYLGIGYCVFYRRKLSEVNLPEIKDVGYVSGAAAMMRTDLLKEYGYWNEDFFMYHEDTEYSFRLKTRGYRTVVVKGAVFYHEYSFKKGAAKFYWLERNRHALKYLIYKWPTWVLLAPLEILYNLGLIIISLAGGWFRELLKVYAYWLRSENWKVWRAERKKYQTERTVSDRAILAISAARVEGEYGIVNKSVNFLANLFFTFYYFLLKIMVWW